MQINFFLRFPFGTHTHTHFLPLCTILFVFRYILCMCTVTSLVSPAVSRIPFFFPFIRGAATARHCRMRNDRRAACTISARHVLRVCTCTARVCVYVCFITVNHQHSFLPSSFSSLPSSRTLPWLKLCSWRVYVIVSFLPSFLSSIRQNFPSFPLQCILSILSQHHFRLHMTVIRLSLRINEYSFY